MIVDNETSLRRPELSAAKRAVLEKRLRGELKHKPKAPVIARRSPSDRAPLSFSQQRIWFLRVGAGKPALQHFDGAAAQRTARSRGAGEIAGRDRHSARITAHPLRLRRWRSGPA